MLNPKSHFGHYKVKSVIGAGGMEEVFLAEDTKLDRQVAIKCLTRDFIQDTDKLNCFIQKAQTTFSLNHSKIITIYKISKIDGIHFIATEYIVGETLTPKIENNSFEFNLNY